MNNNEILLNFNKTDFEEIYFRNFGSNLLFSKKIKTHFILTTTAAALLTASTVFGFTHNRGWGIVTIIAVISVLLFYELIRKISPTMLWKKSIKDMLNAQSKFISQKILVSDSTLTFKQDTKITIVRWANFKRVVIDENSIKLYGEEELLFPKKSMSYQDFDFLREQVLLRMKS